MSEFDDNPFADPFAEPSIRQATQPAPNANNLISYDPFAPGTNTNSTTPAAPQTQQQQQPAVMTPTTMPSTAPPAYAPSAQQSMSSEEFQELKKRQEELEKKAQELARKEEELRNIGTGGARENNWPPLPSRCPINPCFYQDINVDIPLEFQKIVRMLYYLWMFYVLMLLINVLGGLAFYISMGEGQTFGLALLYLVLFSPISYICWFRPIYKAFRSDSSFNFMVFFFVFFFQCCICVAQAVGIPSLGACGWIGVFRAFGSSAIGTGIFLCLVALASTAIAGAMIVLILWVHKIYRSSDASIAKAQAEFTQGVMRNEHVQNVASNAASAAVRNQFGATTPSSATDPLSPRF